MFVCVLWQIPNPPEDEEEQEQEEAGKVAEWGDSKLDRLKDLLGFLLEYFISNKDVAKFFIDHVDARCFPEDKEVSVRGRMKGGGMGGAAIGNCVYVRHQRQLSVYPLCDAVREILRVFP